jgi:peptidoglycan/LPS O-acetylase OafA/YrhL
VGASGRFRADIEGLRAVAVVAVVLYHAGLRSAGGGYVGVDVFYVLSGFLITGLLWRELRETGRLSFASFYARRARRLLPAAMLVVLVTVVGSSLWLSPLQAKVVTRDAIASALYAANYRFAALRTDYLASSAPPSPLQHYWSLGVEEQFYLAWPLLLLLASLAWRRSRGTSTVTAAATVLGVGVASFALSLWLTGLSQPWAFFSLPTRAWELAAGGVVALAAPRLGRLPKPAAVAMGWLGMGAIVWSVIALGASTPFPGTAALLPVGGTVAVVAAGCAPARFGPGILLHRRPFQLGGKLSYSWYLWHWPLLVLAPAAAGHALGLGPNLALAATSALLALATARLVEDPVRYSPRWRSRPGRSLVAGAALTAITTLASAAVAGSLPAPRGHGAAAALARLPSGSSHGTPLPGAAGSAAAARRRAVVATVERAVASAVTQREVPSNLDPSLERAHADQARPFLDGCDDGWRDTGVVPCVYGDKRSATTAVLFGDSHAPQWFPALDPLARSRHWRLISLSKATCPPVEISIWSPVLGRHFHECDQWRAAALQRIRAERPAVVILGAARHYGPEYHFQVYGPAWISGLAQMVRRVRATGAQVLVLGPTPRPKGDVPDCLATHLRDAVTCTQPLSRAIDAAGVRAERAAVVRAGGAYVDVSPWTCTRATCAVIVGNLLVYRDDNHLSTSYPAWLAPVLSAELDRLVPSGRPADASAHRRSPRAGDGRGHGPLGHPGPARAG